MKLFVERWVTVGAIGTRTHQLMLAPVTAPRIGTDRRSLGVERSCTDFPGLIRAAIAIQTAILAHYDLRSI
ncbi:protein of unknown function [Paraburkholderia dioscoreae]|uniref:Uncharacterized protein n=1 Tax=Paraburkholderia dioscoreae TaxID=2604047 RepID=A0A5Q4Z5K5_9BURK|nr:protein of unknown function [Paraburkholderia dioscoreae]